MNQSNCYFGACLREFLAEILSNENWYLKTTLLYIYLHINMRNNEVLFTSSLFLIQRISIIYILFSILFGLYVIASSSFSICRKRLLLLIYSAYQNYFRTKWNWMEWRRAGTQAQTHTHAHTTKNLFERLSKSENESSNQKENMKDS